MNVHPQLLEQAVSAMLGEQPMSVEELQGEITQRITTARAWPHFLKLDHDPKKQEFRLFLSPLSITPDEVERLVSVLRGGGTGSSIGFPEAELIMSPQMETQPPEPGYARMDPAVYHYIISIPYGERLEKMRQDTERQLPVQVGRSLGHSSPNPGAAG